MGLDWGSGRGIAGKNDDEAVMWGGSEEDTVNGTVNRCRKTVSEARGV